MPRIRNVKPDFFLDFELSKLSPHARLLFIGLWTQADKAGRLYDEPHKLKVQILPWDDVDIEKLLSDLTPKFITRYMLKDGHKSIQINKWIHQKPHHTEKDSVIPPPLTVKRRLKHGDLTARKGDGEGKGDGVIAAPAATAPPLSEPDQKRALSNNPVHRLVEAWKKMLEIAPADQKTWDQANFARSCKSAKLLLEIFHGDIEEAADCACEVYDDLQEKGFSCTLETVVKKAHEWRQRNGKAESPA